MSWGLTSIKALQLLNKFFQEFEVCRGRASKKKQYRSILTRSEKVSRIGNIAGSFIVTDKGVEFLTSMHAEPPLGGGDFFVSSKKSLLPMTTSKARPEALPLDSTAFTMEFYLYISLIKHYMQLSIK